MHPTNTARSTERFQPPNLFGIKGNRMSEVSQTSSIADVEVVPDLTFASPNGVALGVDLYLPKTGSIPPPVIVWIHGGAWRANDRKHGPDMRRYFASRGFAMASIDHRLSGQDVFPAQIEDVKTAI